MIKRRQGFTLIEMLVVVSVLAILGIIAITALNPMKILAKTRDNHRKLDIKSVQGVLEMYYGQNRMYPATASVTFGNQLVDGNGTVYLKVVPQDPSTGWGYCYNQVSSSSYVLCSAVEDASNVSIPAGVTSCSPTGAGKAGDYCLTNPF